jgi:TonB family protein
VPDATPAAGRDSPAAPTAADSSTGPAGALMAAAADTTPSASADTSQRVPGTRMRFGWSDRRLAELGFHLDKGGSRSGACTWFGLAANATVRFSRGVLDRAHLEARNLSPRDLAYLQDQLAREGYRRACSSPSTCTWTGQGVEMTTALAADQATAEATRLAPPPPTRTVSVATTAPPSPPRPAAARAAADSVLELASLARTGAVLRQVTPEYPARARTAGVMGRVVVLADVDAAGVVRAARIARGVPLLDAAALRAARGYRFGPAAYGRRVRIPIVFTPY